MFQPRRVAVWVFVLAILAITLPDRYSLTTFHEANSAGRIYPLHAWFGYGSWSFEHILCRTGPGHGVLDMSLVDGRPVLQKAPGLTWLAMIPYGIIWAVSGRPDFHWVSTILTILCVLLPILVCIFVLWRHFAFRFGDRMGLFGCAVLLLASPVMVYSGLFMDYGLTALLIATGFVWLQTERLRVAFFLGVLFGAAITINYYAAAYVAVLVLVEIVRRRSFVWRYWATVAAGMLPPIAALLIYHTMVFGSPFATPYDFLNPVFASRMENLGFRWAPVWDALVGGKNGMWLHAPWTLFGLLGLLMAAIRPKADYGDVVNGESRTIRCEALAGLGVLLVNMVFVSYWTGTHPDDAPFQRHMLPSYPFFAWGLTFFVRRVTHTRWESLRGAVLGAVAVGAFYPWLTSWTFPYHPSNLDSPIWQLNAPLMINGAHVAPLWYTLLDLPREGGPQWLGTGLAAAFTTLALVLAWKKGGLDPLPKRSVVGGALFAGALMLAMVSGIASDPNVDLDESTVSAILQKKKNGVPLQADEAVIAQRLALEKREYSQAFELVYMSAFTDDVWRERGFPGFRPAPPKRNWCDVAMPDALPTQKVK
ncbi:MAG: hypothetical protein HUU55_09515 [Myxococcales bacterium]|nr:hypothetical protein [Myxococcales bacterium]